MKRFAWVFLLGVFFGTSLQAVDLFKDTNIDPKAKNFSAELNKSDANLQKLVQNVLDSLMRSKGTIYYGTKVTKKEYERFCRLLPDDSLPNFVCTGTIKPGDMRDDPAFDGKLKIYKNNIDVALPFSSWVGFFKYYMEQQDDKPVTYYNLNPVYVFVVGYIKNVSRHLADLVKCSNFEEGLNLLLAFGLDLLQYNQNVVFIQGQKIKEIIKVVSEKILKWIDREDITKDQFEKLFFCNTLFRDRLDLYNTDSVFIKIRESLDKKTVELKKKGEFKTKLTTITNSLSQLKKKLHAVNGKLGDLGGKLVPAH